MTSVLKLRQKQREEWRKQTDRHMREMKRAVRKEFPLGATVSYKHGQNRIKGVVYEYPQYDWDTDKVIVLNVKSGSKKEIEAFLLDHRTPDEP